MGYPVLLVAWLKGMPFKIDEMTDVCGLRCPRSLSHGRGKGRYPPVLAISLSSVMAMTGLCDRMASDQVDC
jgi:hypothetical protein